MPTAVNTYQPSSYNDNEWENGSSLQSLVMDGPNSHEEATVAEVVPPRTAHLLRRGSLSRKSFSGTHWALDDDGSHSPERNPETRYDDDPELRLNPDKLLEREDLLAYLRRATINSHKLLKNDAQHKLLKNDELDTLRHGDRTSLEMAGGRLATDEEFPPLSGPPLYDSLVSARTLMARLQLNESDVLDASKRTAEDSYLDDMRKNAISRDQARSFSLSPPTSPMVGQPPRGGRAGSRERSGSSASASPRHSTSRGRPANRAGSNGRGEGSRGRPSSSGAHRESHASDAASSKAAVPADAAAAAAAAEGHAGDGGGAGGGASPAAAAGGGDGGGGGGGTQLAAVKRNLAGALEESPTPSSSPLRAFGGGGSPLRASHSAERPSSSSSGSRLRGSKSGRRRHSTTSSSRSGGGGGGGSGGGSFRMSHGGGGGSARVLRSETAEAEMPEVVPPSVERRNSLSRQSFALMGGGSGTQGGGGGGGGGGRGGSVASDMGSGASQDAAAAVAAMALASSASVSGSSPDDGSDKSCPVGLLHASLSSPFDPEDAVHGLAKQLPPPGEHVTLRSGTKLRAPSNAPVPTPAALDGGGRGVTGKGAAAAAADDDAALLRASVEADRELLSLFAAKEKEADEDAERALGSIRVSGLSGRQNKLTVPPGDAVSPPPGGGSGAGAHPPSPPSGSRGGQAAKKKPGAGGGGGSGSGLDKASASGSFQPPDGGTEQPDITRKQPKAKSKPCCDLQ